MTVFVTSDTHFNHAKILELGRGRPFADVGEMNEALISNWNAVVSKRDEVYHLGDFAYGESAGGGKGRKPSSIFMMLNGKKHLIVGNHDEQNPQVLRLPWTSVSALRHIKVNKRKIALCHYPLETWWHSYLDALHLHGHCHGGLERVISHRFDVGTDVWAFKPMAIEDFVTLADAQEFDPQDHHGKR